MNSGRTNLRPEVNFELTHRPPGHHPDNHQLPLHRDQARLHLPGHRSHRRPSCQHHPVASSPVATSPAEVATTAAPVIPAPASPIFSNSTGPAAPPCSPPLPPQPALLPLRVPLPQSHPSNPSRVPPTGWLRRVLASQLCSDLPLTFCKFSQFGNVCKFPSAFQRVALDGLSPVWSGKSGDTQFFTLRFDYSYGAVYYEDIWDVVIL